MTTNAIRSLISGRPMTFFGTYNGIGFTGSATWNSNGTIVGRTRILGIIHEWKGRWHVRNNRYCRTLSSEGKTDSKCHRVQKIGPRTIRFIDSNGKVTSTTTVN